MQANDIDVSPLRSKIGVERCVDDTPTLRLAQAFQATFDEDPDAVHEGGVAPAGIFWCLGTPFRIQTRHLLADGTDDDGGSSIAALPRRMRAGGGLRFHRPLRVGALVTRRDRLAAVEPKQGRSGPLCFVTAQRDYDCDGELAIEERIDSVYRAPAGEAAATEAPATPAAARPTGNVEPLEVGPLLLVRYSALTFNVHRIHWDAPYAIQQEGYPGLVVHGPLQATLLLRRAAQEAAKTQCAFESFEYRLMKPFILGDHTRLVTQRSGDRFTLAITGQDGVPSMSATATFRNSRVAGKGPDHG